MVATCKDTPDDFALTFFEEKNMAKKKPAQKNPDAQPTLSRESKVWVDIKTMEALRDILKDAYLHTADACKFMNEMQLDSVFIKAKGVIKTHSLAVKNFSNAVLDVVGNQSAAKRLGVPTIAEHNRERYLKYGKKKADAN